MADETVDSLAYLRSGFRAKYLVDAIEKVLSGEIDYQKIKEMPLDDARNELMKIKGVGPKVADCTLLFGFLQNGRFPKRRVGEASACTVVSERTSLLCEGC